jgi:ribose transport system permease protein
MTLRISTVPDTRWSAAAYLARQRSLKTPSILFVLLIVIAAFKGPHLFTSEGLGGAIIGAAPLVLATLAMTPIAIAGPAGVDLSIGPAMTFINIAVVLGLPEVGLSDPVSVFAFAILLGILLQVIMGTLIAILRVSTVVVTLALYLVLDGMNTVILPQSGGSAPDWLANWGSVSTVFSAVLYVPVAAFLLWAVTARTTFFRNVRLMGANDRTAFVSGIPLIPTRIGAHVIAGIFVGVASVMYTGLIGSADPTAGTPYTLSAVTALIIGGASLGGGNAKGLGSVLGALDLWLISYVLSTFNFGLDASYWVQFTTGAVLVVSLVAGGVLSGAGQPRGSWLPKWGKRSVGHSRSIEPGGVT